MSTHLRGRLRPYAAAPRPNSPIAMTQKLGAIAVKMLINIVTIELVTVIWLGVASAPRLRQLAATQATDTAPQNATSQRPALGTSAPAVGGAPPTAGKAMPLARSKRWSNRSATAS